MADPSVTESPQKPAFNPVMHQPPRIDQFGFNKKPKARLGDDGSNILKHPEAIHVPTWWQHEVAGGAKTNTELAEQRRKSKIPDPSFDLDGDGNVGGRDYVISKLFDKDGDGKLNAEERAAAMEAVKNGIEDKFFWNVEQAGAQRPYRIMQKRGVFVDAEDFLPVTGTYPAHPISSHDPKYKTTGDLKQARHDAYRTDVLHKTAEFEKHTKKVIAQFSRIPDEGYVANPYYTSINQRKSDNKKAARTKAGLTETTEDPKHQAGQPGLSWNRHPVNKSCAELLEQRRVQNLEQLRALEANIGSIKNAEQRLNEREQCFLRMQQKEGKTKTKGDIVEKRRQEMIDENTQKFGEQTIGIHGQELPQYSRTEESKRWWKYFPRGDPKVDSLLQLKQNTKYWAQDDQMLLSDVKPEAGPADPFKVNRVQKPQPRGVSDKVTRQNHWSNDSLLGVVEPRINHKMKVNWSEHMSQFNGKERLLDGIITKANAYEANDLRREIDTGAFHKQRKRGTTTNDDKHQKSQNSTSNHQQQMPRSQAQPKPSQSQNVQQSRATTQETIDPAAKNNQTSARPNDSEPTNPMMQMTLMSRMTGLNRTMPAAAFAAATAANVKGKDMNNTGSTNNMASAKTATSMTGGNNTKFGETMNGTFKDSTARGIVSGMGLLTFS